MGRVHGVAFRHDLGQPEIGDLHRPGSLVRRAVEENVPGLEVVVDDPPLPARTTRLVLYIFDAA